MSIKHPFTWARRLAITLVASMTLLTQGTAQAQASINVDISYEGNEFVVDFSGAAWRDDVEAVVLLSCDDSDNCSELERITLFANYSFRRGDIGLFKLEFRRTNVWWLPDYAEVLWEQFAANIARPSTALAAAAERHAPLFSFHAREGFFPVSLEALFGQPLEAFDVFGTGAPVRVARNCTSTTIVCASADTSASSYMARNAHLGLRLFLRPEIATSRALSGSKTDFPVYWFSEVSGSTAWVTYSVFYAYDDKRPEYVAFSESEGAGDHAIDRESVSVRFTQVNGNWQPDEVVYAGHLPNQPNTFRGCADWPACTGQGALSVTWTDGRTRLPWASAAKRGSRPIVYVADGSHAVLPAFGWYFLNVTGIGAPFNVTEPAGSSSSTALNSGRLTLLDLNNPAHSALKFSGYLINAPGPTNYRVFPFVRYPIRLWAGVAGNAMAPCASGDCRPYIHNLPLVTGLTPQSAVVGESTEFTLRGENLVPLLVEVSNCAGLTTTETRADEVRIRCTPERLGAVSLAMRRSATGEVLETRTVAVTSTSTGGMLPHTGITANQCYEAGSDVLVGCSSAGALALNSQQDGHRVNLNPMSYSEVPNPAGGYYARTECLRDNVTGLIWETKTVTGTRAANNAYTNYGDGRVDDASAYVNTVNAIALCDQVDWRLPTARELQQLTDFAIPKTLNVSSFGYWTSEADFFNLNAIFVQESGEVFFSSRSSMKNIRLVRGIARPVGRFSYTTIPYEGDAANNAVVDADSKLIWRRCSEGQTWSGATCIGTPSGFTYEQALRHSQIQVGWRMPNIKELFTIVDRSQSVSPNQSPYDANVFPGVPEETNNFSPFYRFYRSSTPSIWSNIRGLAYTVAFSDGSSDNIDNSIPVYLRIVRDAPPN